MRRFLAILLLTVFGSFLGAPMFAASPDTPAELPACCRRNGKHHCMMRIMMERGLPFTTVSAPAKPCPFFPKLKVVILPFGHFLQPPTQERIYAGLLQHPACHAQVLALYRIAFDRSRQKRGPPGFTLS